VRERFPTELRTLRNRHVNAALVVMVDADRATVEQRCAALDAACTEVGVETRESAERVAVFVPRRNIETWIAYLGGRNVNEDDRYPRLHRERDCDAGVRALWEMCTQQRLREPAPPSLQTACKEYDQRRR
jgi:hypothetical protein